ncbi:proline-, glutamic acid- and leucine-rich protein 1-like [Penaeus vannamei]|uniref:proline-, glutamic acid- and leucine-rich protein 1-like n=1 Tax=Penaeus vannamei TaxID=6689 RepID=UPI00387F6FA5
MKEFNGIIAIAIMLMVGLSQERNVSSVSQVGAYSGGESGFPSNGSVKTVLTSSAFSSLRVERVDTAKFVMDQYATRRFSYTFPVRQQADHAIQLIADELHAGLRSVLETSGNVSSETRRVFTVDCAVTMPPHFLDPETLEQRLSGTVTLCDITIVVISTRSEEPEMVDEAEKDPVQEVDTDNMSSRESELEAQEEESELETQEEESELETQEEEPELEAQEEESELETQEEEPELETQEEESELETQEEEPELETQEEEPELETQEEEPELETQEEEPELETQEEEPELETQEEEPETEAQQEEPEPKAQQEEP